MSTTIDTSTASLLTSLYGTPAAPAYNNTSASTSTTEATSVARATDSTTALNAKANWAVRTSTDANFVSLLGGGSGGSSAVDLLNSLIKAQTTDSSSSTSTTA